MMKKNATKKIILAALLFLTALFPLSLKSQRVLSYPVSLNSLPTAPSPGESVQFFVSTPSFDSNTAAFNWYINGRLNQALSGIGKNSITLAAGNTGSALEVAVVVLSPDGIESRAEISAPVAGLELTWFAETSVPKWYKGKALPVEDSVVDFVALPDFAVGGSRFNDSQLIYNWSLDGQPGMLSGIGKNIFRVRMSGLPGSYHKIDVTVSDPGKNITKTASSVLKPFSPKAVIYHSTPLGGVETRSASMNFMSAAADLLDFVVEPFFLPLNSGTLAYSWTVGDEKILDNASKGYLLTVNTNNFKGNSVPISVKINDSAGAWSALGFLNILLNK